MADCDTPGCTDRIEGRDDDELFQAIRKHVDTVHPEDPYTDEQSREWMASAAYTVEDPDLGLGTAPRGSQRVDTLMDTFT